MSIEQQLSTIHPLEWLITQKQIPGIQEFNSFGKIDDVDRVDAPIPIWHNHSDYTFLTSPATLYLSSSDNTDTCFVDVYGLDENWNIQYYQGEVTGQTQNALPGLWMRILDSERRGSAVQSGDIYIAESDAAPGGVPADDAIKSILPQNCGRNHMAISSVAAGYTGLFTYFYVSLQRGLLTTGSVDLRLRRRRFEENFVTLAYFSIGVTGGGPSLFKMPSPVLFPEKSDIMFDIASLSSDNMSISAGFQMLHCKTDAVGQWVY